MYKIHDGLLKRIVSTPMSNYCIKLLLEIIRVSDEKGYASIYYKDMADTIGCSVAQYYNALHTLQKKYFIDYLKSDEYACENDVHVIGNDFCANYKNYVDINVKFIVDRQYLNFKAGEIRAYLYVVWKIAKQHNKKAEGNRLPHGTSALAKIIGVSVRYAEKYIKTLCEHGLISYVKKRVGYYSPKKKNDIITLNKKESIKGKVCVSEKGKPTEVTCNQLFGHFVHLVKAICRRTRKTFTDLSLNDTAMLYVQYQKVASKQGKDIAKLISTAINDDIGKDLDSKAVHYILRNLLNIDYAQSIILT